MGEWKYTVLSSGGYLVFVKIESAEHAECSNVTWKSVHFAMKNTGKMKHFC